MRKILIRMMMSSVMTKVAADSERMPEEETPVEALGITLKLGMATTVIVAAATTVALDLETRRTNVVERRTREAESPEILSLGNAWQRASSESLTLTITPKLALKRCSSPSPPLTATTT